MLFKANPVLLLLGRTNLCGVGKPARPWKGMLTYQEKHSRNTGPTLQTFIPTSYSSAKNNLRSKTKLKLLTPVASLLLR